MRRTSRCYHLEASKLSRYVTNTQLVRHYTTTFATHTLHKVKPQILNARCVCVCVCLCVFVCVRACMRVCLCVYLCPRLYQKRDVARPRPGRATHGIRNPRTFRPCAVPIDALPGCRQSPACYICHRIPLARQPNPASLRPV